MKHRTAAAADLETDRRGGASRVVGSLGFSTVSALLPPGSEAIGGGQASVIDLAGVTDSDSAGLALLIEWLSVAQHAGRKLRYENIAARSCSSSRG